MNQHIYNPDDDKCKCICVYCLAARIEKLEKKIELLELRQHPLQYNPNNVVLC